MKILFIIIGTILTLNCVAQSPSWVWVKSAGGSINDEASSVAVDSFGNTFVTGYFSSPTINFGTFTLTNTSGYSNMFITKYAPNGNVIWAKSAEGPGEIIANSIAVDGAGNAYVTGEYFGQYISFGVNPFDTLYYSDICFNCGRDYFLVKYDSSGNLLWAKGTQLDSTAGFGTEYSKSVTVDVYGNSYIAGTFDVPIIFGSDTLLSEGVGNIFLAKFDSNGNSIWAKRAGGMDSDKATSLAVDASGNIIMTGFYQDGAITFDSITLNNPGYNSTFLVKYDSSGSVLWAKSPHGSNFNASTSIVVDSLENIYLTGYFNGTTIIFETDTVNETGMFNIFLAKYAPNGNVIWATGAGGSNNNRATSVAVNSSGNIYIAGYFVASTLIFGDDTLTHSGSFNDIFLAKYASDGSALSAISVTGASTDFDYNVAMDATGNTLVGYFQGATITFGNITLTKVSGNDIFVAKIKDILTAEAGNNVNAQCGNSVQLNVTSDYTGTGIISYQWSPSTGLNNTNISNPTATVFQDTKYNVSVTTLESGTATDSVTVYVNPFPILEICYVEFDTTTSKNSINWSTNLSVNIDTVHIFNEVSTNVWNLIGSIPASQSNFIDTNSNPFNQSYSYKISILDKCNNETSLSAFHTTVTLLATYDIGTNTYGFAWSPYYGLTIANYYLYGITASGTETLIGSVPGNQYFYNYTNPYLGFKKYFIGFNTPTCSSKTNHLVKSNYVNATTGIEENAEINNLVSIYPNPVINNLNLQTDLQIIKIEITDITGRLLYTIESKTIDCSNFSKGVYFIKVYSSKGIAVNKFVKE